MLLREPARTQADLLFSILGFPVRVSVWFWAGSTFFGWGIISSSNDARDKIANFVLWSAACFLSILIHELGHALAMRKYGMNAHIVLFHMGGVAMGSGAPRQPKSQIIISLAGPMAQISAALVMACLIAASGHLVTLPWFFDNLISHPEGIEFISNRGLRIFTQSFIHVSILWAVFNLLPIHPLDGGQISRQLFILYDRGPSPIKKSLIVSIATAGIMILLAMSGGSVDTFMMVLFLSLAANNYMELQGYMTGGGGFRGRGW